MTRRKIYAKGLAVLLCFCLTSSWLPTIVSQAVGIETEDGVPEEGSGEAEEESSSEAEETEDTGTDTSEDTSTDASKDPETESSKEEESESTEEVESTEASGTDSTEESEMESGTGAETEAESTLESTMESTEAVMMMDLTETNLADLIDSANDGDTINLQSDTSYMVTSDIKITESLQIIGGENTKIVCSPSGDVYEIICTKDITLKNLDIQAFLTCDSSADLSDLILHQKVKGKAAFKMENCVAYGGVIVEDSDNDITLWGNKMHFDGDITKSGLYIPGQGQGQGPPLKGNYKIGDSEYTDTLKANTFINNGENATRIYNISNNSSTELNAYGNYWKKGETDAPYGEIPMNGPVMYATKLPIKFHPENISEPASYLPQSNFKYNKGTNTGSGLEDGDYVNMLYERSFETRDAAPFIDVCKFNRVYQTNGFFISTDKDYELKVATSDVYKNDTYHDSDRFTEAEVLDHTWVPGDTLYIRVSGLMMPATVTPKSMVSYAGDKSNALPDTFPSLRYRITTPNYLYGKSDLLGNGENFELQFLPEYETSPDTLPFETTLRLGGSGTSATVNTAGSYKIEVKGKSNTPGLSYSTYFQNTWTPPRIFINWDDAFDIFDTEFKEGELIVRPTSSNVTTKGIFSNTPDFSRQSQPVAVMDGQAQHKDSTGQVLRNQSVSLLNDNQEPNEAAYQAMLEKAKNNTATKDMTYEYHFLSLLNMNDGNHVVTSTDSKTVYIPYPSDYKEDGALKLLYFDGYQRMLSDDIDMVSVIQGTAITKLDKGFTFTTTGNMGAYLIAYDKGITPPSTTEAETTEAGTTEAETTEAGTTEAGTTEAGTTEAGTTEAGTTEAGTTEAETTVPGTTAAPQPTTSSGNGGNSGSDNDSPGPTKPTTAPTAPVSPSESLPPGELVTPGNPLEPISPTQPVVFPEDSEQPATPNYKNPPGGGGAVVKGEDGLYYHISDDNVPLAYYSVIEDTWVPLGNFNPELAGLPKTGELWQRTVYPAIMMILVAGILMTVITVRRRRLE